MPSVLETFYENEEILEFHKCSDKLLEFYIKYYNKIFNASFDALPEFSQNIFRMVNYFMKI